MELQTRRATRRTVAKGVAWATPVAIVATAAPAVAASGSACLTAMWTEAVYSGAGGKWGFTFSFVNCGSADLKVTEIQVFTTYHDPAANTTTDPQVVQTLQPNLTVKATKSGGFQSGRTAFSPPPRDASATSMLPKYYNDYPTITDGTIACQHTAVTPSDPGYPDCAKRLAHDGCFVRITYTQGGVLQPLLTLTFDDTVACAVVAGCK